MLTPDILVQQIDKTVNTYQRIRMLHLSLISRVRLKVKRSDIRPFGITIHTSLNMNCSIEGNSCQSIYGEYSL